MSVYQPYYTPLYMPGFPATPLGVTIELDVGGWTDITGRNVHQNAIAASITRARQNETTQATPSTCALKCDNTDGNLDPDNPVGTWYGLLGLNTPVRVSVPDSTTYLRLENDNQSWVSCPDATSLQLTGNFDVRVDMRLDDWQPCTLAGKWGGSTASWAWCLTLNADGTITLYWYDGANVNTAQSTAPLPYGRVMARALFDAGDLGDPAVYFYTAPDMAGSQTQLGAAVPVGAADYAQAAAGQETDIGYVYGFIGQGLPTGNSGLTGQVYEVAIYNAGTLAADPQFTAQTAAASSFTDAQGNTWSLNGTAELSARAYRYHGECSSLPEEWDPTGHDIWTPVAASGLLRRIQAGNSPAPSVMRRGVVNDIAVNWNVLAYWPCEDAQGSQQIASGLPGGTPMRFAGTPGFQGTAGSPSADDVFACSAQIAQPGTSSWVFAVPPHTAGGSGDTAVFLLAIPSGGISADADLVTLTYAGNDYLTLQYTTAADGSLDVTGPGIFFLGPTGVNGLALWIGIDTTTGITALNVLADGETTETAYTANTGFAAAMIGGRVNPAAADLGATEIGHLWASDSAPSLESYAQLLAGYAGETAAARFARVCAENAITARIWGPPSRSAAMQAQQIDTLSNLLQSCEDADRGQIFEPRTILGLGYRTVATLCNQPPAVTADYSLGEISPPLKPTRDDLNVRNDQVITRNNGSSYQAQITTGPLSVLPPPDGAGDYQNSLTVYCNLDSQLPGIAWWMAWTGTAPGKRYPVIYFDLASTDADMQALIPFLRDADIGDHLQITGTPQPLLPPGDIDQLAWGVKEDIGDFAWRISFNAVPESPYEVAAAGTAVAASSGTTLATGYSDSATSLSVDVTGTPWVTGTVSIPMMIAGELVTVTSISSSSSPQAFTVTRSVNGVSKAQASGAAVTLAAQPVAALAA